MPEPDPASSLEFSEAAGLSAYAAVAARRTSWDSLLWQVPVLSLTAQAFLFVTALGPDSAWWARIIASTLSINLTVLSIRLMARHRQGELNDAHWLADFEREVMKLGAWAAHGKKFRDDRQKVTDIDVGWVGKFIPLKPMFAVWVIGLALFGLFSAGIIVVTVVDRLT